MKGQRIVKQRNAITKQTYVEIEKLLGSPVEDNGDEIAQFQADRFIDDLFCLVWPKRILKKTVNRPLEAGNPQEETRFPLPCKMDDNHNECDCAMVEKACRPLFNSPRNSPLKDTKIQQDDPTEVKMKELDFLLKEGYEAYSLGQYGLAASKYKLAWEIMGNNSLKSRIGHFNEDTVCYMLSLSLLETDQLNNLLEAVELLLALETRSSHIFPAVYFALSKAHHKHYRFALALEAIDKGLAFLGGDVILTDFKVPGSDVTIRESTTDGLLISLNDMKDECSKWHPPDAVCSMSECLPSSRLYGPNRNIYFRDPSFNGMVVLTCSNARNPCTVKFHSACWKSKKDQLSVLTKLSDKDIIGYECFTPNCEHGQGIRSLITKVEVYGDDGKLKTHIDAPTNPVVWMKRKPSPKGAIPKQQIKPKRNLEKLRRPVATAVPRSGYKEAVGENRSAEKEWRIAKLLKLRENNFGIKPAYVWRPDMKMYGNPQMMEIGDFLGGPIFENDCSKLVAIKTFLFTYFYEFIKEDGCVKKSDIMHKWEEDKFIFDNHTDVLSSETDIWGFLLQSYKLVSLGDYVGIAENLPELYAIFRNEICNCLRFLLIEPPHLRTMVLQDNASNAMISNNKDKKNAPDSDDMSEVFLPVTASPDYLHPNLDPNGHQCSENHTHSWNSVSQDIPAFTESKASNNVTETSVEQFAFSGNRNRRLDSNDFKELEESDHPNIQLHFPENSFDSTDNHETNPHSVLYTKEGHIVEPLIDSKKDIPHRVYDLPQEKELTTGLLVVEEGPTEDSHIHETESGDCKRGSLMDHVIEKHCNTQEIESQIGVTDIKCEYISTDDNDTDGMEPSSENCSQKKSCIVDGEFPKSSLEEKPDCVVVTGTESSKTTTETATPSASQFQDTLTESNVQKIENDLAVMVQTVTQLKSVLEQNQVRSESNAQMLQIELNHHKMVSQESMAVLMKDLKRLEARYAKLESEKLEIINKFQKCEIDLRQSNDENIVLTLKNTELMHNYDKLNEEKNDIEHNFNLLLKDKSVVENKMEMLQRERDKMDKKLQKYHARLKEKNATDAESERQTLAATKLSERKSKLESLSQEYKINRYALEKAFEKCYDHVSMLNDVSKLIGSLTGQPFIVTETHTAWRDTEQRLHCTIQQYKEDYSKLKTILESDREIENLSEISLPTLNIVLPESPNLIGLYSKYIHHHMPVPTFPWPAMQRVYHQDPRYVPCAANAVLLGQNLEPRVNGGHTTPGGAGVRINDYSQKFGAENLPQRNRNEINSGRFQRKENSALQEGTSIADSEPSLQDSSLLDRDNDDEGLSQASSYTSTAGGSAHEDTSQTSVGGQSNSSKKVGKDLLIQELKKKFIGVPLFDLLASVQDVRKLHNDSLSGMRLQDIMKEAGMFINQRQAKHMAIYSPSKQMLSPDRPIPQQNETRHRKIPSSMLLGQQRKTQGIVQAKKTSKLVNSSSKVVPARVSAVNTKPAWRPVTSGLAEWKKDQKDSECHICLEFMNSHDKSAPIYILPCQHSFHTSCLKQWLGENSSCPDCRIHCTMDDEFPPLPS